MRRSRLTMRDGSSRARKEFEQWEDLVADVDSWASDAGRSRERADVVHMI
jgi:hypothetical protein